MKQTTVIAASVVAIALISVGLYLAVASNEITSEIILNTSTTVIGQDVEYPVGPSLVTSKIINIPPGMETGPHKHDYPMYAYVMEGEVTVDYGEKGIKRFVKGDSFVEGINYTHNGKNTGDRQTKILTVLIGEE